MPSKTPDWPEQLIALAQWAFQKEDLRHSFLHSKDTSELSTTAGVALGLETTLVLAIYQAALSKGFLQGKTIDYERPYPKFKPKNPKRADLAFKRPGKGTKWGYVEAKEYNVIGKKATTSDIAKLRGIDRRAQRWLLTYRVKSIEEGSKEKPLMELLKKHFSEDFEIKYTREFKTRTKGGGAGMCEICLSKVSR